VTDLSIKIPQGSNATLTLQVNVMIGGSEVVDHFIARIVFGYYCDPSLVDFSHLTGKIVGNLLTNATDTTMFQSGLVDHQGVKYPSLDWCIGEFVKYIHAKKCPLLF
jgi:hypothetical protein